MKEHPKAIGDRTEAHVLAALVSTYPNVLLPWGENTRYDLVVDTGDRFIRVQCKTGHLSNGAVRFNTRSLSYHHPKHGGNGTAEYCSSDYVGQADMFGVYCVENRRVYLVPVADVPTTFAALRIEPTRNGQAAGIRWADAYELYPPE